MLASRFRSARKWFEKCSIGTTGYNFNGVQIERRFSFKALFWLDFPQISVSIQFKSFQTKWGLIRGPIRGPKKLAPEPRG
jgi:hypothetical protein